MSTITKINVGGIDYDIGGSGGTRIATQGTKYSLQVNSPVSTGDKPCGEGGVDLQFNRSSVDKTAKGDYSFVAGFDNKAAGDFSVAVGASNQALSKHSVATGLLCRNTIAGSVNNNNRKNQWMSSQFGGCGFKGFITTYTDANLFKLSNTDVLIARIDVLSKYSYEHPVSFFIEVQASEIVKLNTITVEGYDDTSTDFPVLMMLNGTLCISRVADRQIGIFYTLYSDSNANSSSSSSSSGSGSSSSSSY